MINPAMQSIGSWFKELRDRPLTAQLGVLGLAVAAVFAVVGPLAWSGRGMAGLAAAAIAAAICLLGAALALVACHKLRDPKYGLQCMLIGTLLRMGIPLGAALAVQAQGGALAQAGLLVYLIVFYPVTLGLEVFMSLPSGDRDGNPSNVPRDLASR